MKPQDGREDHRLRGQVLPDGRERCRHSRGAARGRKSRGLPPQTRPRDGRGGASPPWTRPRGRPGGASSRTRPLRGGRNGGRRGRRGRGTTAEGHCLHEQGCADSRGECSSAHGGAGSGSGSGSESGYRRYGRSHGTAAGYVASVDKASPAERRGSGTRRRELWGLLWGMSLWTRL